MRPHFAVQLALVAGLAGASACNPNTFDVTLTGETTVQGDPLSAGSQLTRIPAIGSFASIDFAASEEFRQNQVTKDAVQSLKVTQLSVRILHPNTQGFDFLDELSFFAAAGGKELLVAESVGISTLNLEPPNPTLSLGVNQDAELRELLGAPNVSLTARGSGRQPPQDTVLEATVKLRVVLKFL